MKIRPGLDEIISMRQLRLSPAFVERLEREGKDVGEAKRATARIIADHFRPNREGVANLENLMALYREGLVDINATYHNNHYHWVDRWPIYYTVVSRENMTPFLHQCLPGVEDELMHRRVCRDRDHSYSLLGFARAKPQAVIALLRDPRTDPWQPVEEPVEKGPRPIKRPSFVDHVHSMVLKPGGRQAGLVRMSSKGQSYVLALMDTGIPVRRFLEVGSLKQHFARVDAICEQAGLGEVSLADLPLGTIKQCCSVKGYDAIFDPDLWQGQEAAALERIGQLPEWAQRMINPSHIMAFHSRIRPSWRNRAQPSAGTFRGYP